MSTNTKYSHQQDMEFMSNDNQIGLRGPIRGWEGGVCPVGAVNVLVQLITEGFHNGCNVYDTHKIKCDTCPCDKYRKTYGKW